MLDRRAKGIKPILRVVIIARVNLALRLGIAAIPAVLLRITVALLIELLRIELLRIIALRVVALRRRGKTRLRHRRLLGAIGAHHRLLARGTLAPPELRRATDLSATHQAADDPDPPNHARHPKGCINSVK